MIPSFFPIFNPSTRCLGNGLLIQASSFCEKSVHSKPECLKHYESMNSRGEGYYQCPFGMSSRNLYYAGKRYVVTGVVAFPRFGTDAEQSMARRFPGIKVAREAIEANVRAIREIESLRATAVQEAGKVLPQALHELRKLNGAVLQHAEKEIGERGETPGLLTIRSAAELMRNNFDILEALSNIEGMKALPTDATINLFDLTYKTKRVFEQRASARSMQIHLDGKRAIIPGNQKSFPIVPAVLLENAIKYGKPGKLIRAEVEVVNNKATLTVENETDSFIDPARCFDRGVRFSDVVEGGGFGLFLAKEIVVSHNGSIRCEPSKGKVRMVVELPLVDVIPQKFQ